MKKLTLQSRFCLSAVIIFAAALAAALVFRFSWCEYCALFALMGGALSAALYFSIRSKLAAAKTIADSAVIRIRPAILCGQTEEENEEEELRENFGIHVSCFGILLGTKIIKFNQNGVWLKNVEIGNDYISFGYGARGEELKSIRLLYSKPDDEKLAEVIENFRKETGVIPVIKEKNYVL